VDGYAVQGNGTLFDGTTVESGQAPATLRLDGGTEIKLATNSHGVVHRDRLVLLSGETQLKTMLSPFFLEADGLRVVPGGPNALGIVSLRSENRVDVAAVAGKFQITDGKGFSLANMSPGATMSFYPAASAAAQGGSVIEGLVSYRDGNYYLTTHDNSTYQLIGKDLQKFVNDKVVVVGTLQAATTPSGPPQFTVEYITINAPAGSNRGKIVYGALIAGGGAGIALAVFGSQKSASR